MRSLVLVISTLLLLAAGDSIAAGADGESEAYLLITGEVQGGFGPCGCAAGPEGGLARRIGYTEKLSRERSTVPIQLDAGNYFAGPGPDADAVNRLMKAGMGRLPLSVLNLGVEDLYWWGELSTHDTPTRIISTNLEPRRDSIVRPPRYALVEIPLAEGATRATVTAGVLGLVDPSRVKPNSGFRAIDPVEAVLEVKDEVLQKADFLVVLFDTIRPQGGVPSDWVVKRLAEAVPEIYLVATTERRFVLYQPIQIGSAVVVSTIERGRYLTELKLTLGPDGDVQSIEADFIELGEGVPEDDEFLRAERALSARLQ